MYSLRMLNVANKANDNIRSMGRCPDSPALYPKSANPVFQSRTGKIEIGMGIHGEPGIMLSDRMPADELVDMLMGKAT